MLPLLWVLAGTSCHKNHEQCRLMSKKLERLNTFLRNSRQSPYESKLCKKIGPEVHGDHNA